MPRTTEPRAGSASWNARFADLDHGAIRISIEQVDRRRADEAGDEQRIWALVEILGGAFLLDATGMHDHYAIGHRCRFDLIVGDKDRGYAEFALDATDLGAHGEPQSRVEVRQRLVEQKQVRPLDQRPGERDALLLAARELARPPVEKSVDAHERRDLPRARLGLRCARPS